MRKWHSLLDTMRFPLQILVLAFMFLGIASFIKNEYVNIFYTFKDPITLALSDILMNISLGIISNFPLIVIIRMASRRAKSGTPILVGVVGYISFLVVTMVFSSQNLPNYAYAEVFNIRYYANDVTNFTKVIKYPLQCGLIAAFIVGIATRFSYVTSRRRNSYSLLSFMDKNTVAYIYNILICSFGALVTVYIWPYFINLINYIITNIGQNINNPEYIALYGAIDRIFSILGLSDFIRTSFWYDSLGGSVNTFSGTAILGDVNAWTHLISNNLNTNNFGRFITPYYILNIFIVPAVIMAFYSMNTNKADKKKMLFISIVLCFFSVVYGNPLVLEFVLLFAAPLLFVLHIFLTALLFYLCEFFKIRLGFIYNGLPSLAMPGNLPDYLYFLRNPDYNKVLLYIFMIGIGYAAIYFIITRIYIKFLAFDFLNTGKKKNLCIKLVTALGGIQNIKEYYSNPFKASITLHNQQAIDIKALQHLGLSKISETALGVNVYFGMASYILVNEIHKFKMENER